MNASGRTAITRTSLSAPMAWLHQQGKLTGKCLDYGCGKGFDCDALGILGFDPNHRKSLADLKAMLTGGFRTITCNYVLNVIESE
ncbi:MAG: hypothetical protein K2R98_19360 [Gemmataceae bacterium]|nr:hypothetical protein [Gemmataceae bacterium]